LPQAFSFHPREVMTARPVIESLFCITRSKSTASKIGKYVYDMNAKILGLTPTESVVSTLNEMKLDDKDYHEVSAG
jgi:hypothetical protein